MRRSDPALADLLFQEPYRFDFFQAVRLLETIREGRSPVGLDGHPSDEVVRFVGHLSLTFPPSSIESLEPGPSAGKGHSEPSIPGPPRMTTPFMGLIGASGALPTVYTEALIALKTRRRNAPALDFLDLFHHRLVSHFYRAWEKYNVPALWERGNREAPGEVGRDAFSKHLFELIGLGPGAAPQPAGGERRGPSFTTPGSSPSSTARRASWNSCSATTSASRRGSSRFMASGFACMKTSSRGWVGTGPSTAWGSTPWPVRRSGTIRASSGSAWVRSGSRNSATSNPADDMPTS